MDNPEIIVQSFEFMKEDPRWHGAVEVVERTNISQERGNEVQNHLRLRVGSKHQYLALPRRGLDEILVALQLAKASVDARFESKMFDRSIQKRPHERRK